jgi:hypothetical protein
MKVLERSDIEMKLWKLNWAESVRSRLKEEQDCEIVELLLNMLEVNFKKRWSAAACESYLEVPPDTLDTVPPATIAGWDPDEQLPATRRGDSPADEALEKMPPCPPRRQSKRLLHEHNQYPNKKAHLDDMEPKRDRLPSPSRGYPEDAKEAVCKKDEEALHTAGGNERDGANEDDEFTESTQVAATGSLHVVHGILPQSKSKSKSKCVTYRRPTFPLGTLYDWPEEDQIR